MIIAISTTELIWPNIPSRSTKFDAYRIVPLPNTTIQVVRVNVDKRRHPLQSNANWFSHNTSVKDTSFTHFLVQPSSRVKDTWNGIGHQCAITGTNKLYHILVKQSMREFYACISQLNTHNRRSANKGETSSIKKKMKKTRNETSRKK